MRGVAIITLIVTYYFLINMTFMRDRRDAIHRDRRYVYDDLNAGNPQSKVGPAQYLNHMHTHDLCQWPAYKSNNQSVYFSQK